MERNDVKGSGILEMCVIILRLEADILDHGIAIQ
jgi:hypothetical protein